MPGLAKVLRSATLLIAFVTGLLPAMAQSQQTPTIEILSKEDARAVFSMSKEQWVVNVQQAADAGMARPMGNPDIGLGMAMTGPNNDLLIVRPSYGEQEQKPDFIQVTVGYRYPKAALLTDVALQDAIQTTRAQMAPEYDVIGNVEDVPGGISIFFIITENMSE